MKKIFILLAITFMAFNANAQWFLGGGAGLNATIQETPQQKLSYYTIEKSREYLVGFALTPKMGYYFKEKLALGLEPSIGVNFANTSQLVSLPQGGYDYVKIEETYINWRIAPFLRYAVFTHKKFALMLEGSVGVGGQHAIRSEYSVIGVGVINIVPVLGYKLTDRLQLEATLNFINLGYNIDVHLAGKGDNKQKMIVHDLNIGFNAKSVFVLSQLSIGVIYKFN